MAVYHQNKLIAGSIPSQRVAVRSEYDANDKIQIASIAVNSIETPIYAPKSKTIAINVDNTPCPEGTPIAQITVDGDNNTLYAPKIEVEQTVTTGTELANIKINNVNHKIYANVQETDLKAIYPVGSIYISTSKTLPDEFNVGMTWKPIACGKCLWGADENGTDANTSKSSGLPNITGGFILESGFIASASGAMTATGSDQYETDKHATGYNSVNFDASKSNSIYGQSDIVQPPALVVRMWERIN